MERLSDLPPKNDTQMSPKEEDVMKKYFDPPKSKENFGDFKMGWLVALKIAFYATILFAALANPWADGLICMAPYCGDNFIILLAIKSLLFLILLTCVYKFVV